MKKLIITTISLLVWCIPFPAWAQQNCGGTKLSASNGSASDYFGYASAISGDVALIGAMQDDTYGPTLPTLFTSHPEFPLAPGQRLLR